MNDNLFLKETGLVSPSDAILKVTALQYLREALLKEEYERCQELLECARRFGAKEREIARALKAASQGKEGGPPEASRGKNRLFR